MLYLFSIYAPDLSGVDISALRGFELLDLLSRISTYPRGVKATPTRLEGDIPAVIANEERTEAGEMATVSRHVLVICGDRLFNLMLGYPSMLADDLPLDTLIALQDMLVARFANDAYQPVYSSSYALAGTDIRWSLPADSLLMLETEDEDTFKEIVMVLPEQPNVGVLSLWAIHEEAYDGHTIATLDEALVKEAVERWSLGSVDMSSMMISSDSAGGLPVLRYGETNGATTYHYMMGIREGWMLVLSFMQHENADAERIGPLFIAVMRTVMGGEWAYTQP